MRAARHFRNCRVVAVRIRRGVLRADGRPAGERDRQVHFVTLATSAPAPPVLKTLCGDLLDPDAAELLDGISGMPCVKCFSCVPQATDAPAGPSRDRRRSA